MEKVCIQPYYRKAYYYETDQMGIVHHSNFIRWLEEARIESMNQWACPYKKMEEEGILIPVLEVQCTYKSMVTFEEPLAIWVQPLSFNGIKVSFSYKKKNKETKAIKAKARTSHCFLNKDKRILNLKKENPKLYKQFSKFFSQGT